MSAPWKKHDGGSRNRAQVRGGNLKARLMRWRRAFAERLGVFRWSVTGAWPLLAERLPQRGTFLEAGAHDGWTGSNTYSLERIRGWKGVLVEPAPQLAAACRRNRPNAPVVEAALISRTDKREELQFASAGLVSFVEGSPIASANLGIARDVFRIEHPERVRVRAMTLDAILEQEGFESLDFLSLDVEGLEGEALAGIDLERWGVRWILVECNDPGTVRALLEPRYERLATYGSCDVLYGLRRG